MFFISLLLALGSLLSVFRAPVRFLWIPAIAATEGGHWLALGCLILVLWGPRIRPSRPGTAGLALGAALLFLSPIIRAIGVARKLPSDLSRAFGPASPGGRPDAPARRNPLSLSQLVRGLPRAAVHRDTRYFPSAGGPMLGLDLFYPDRPNPAGPAVLIIHGGSWQSGDRTELTALNRYLAARGYLVASMDYRLAPRWHFPAARDDVFKAIEYLRKNAAELGWNGRQIALIGRSAGGQLALSAAYARREAAICGVVALYAPNDLAFAYAHPSNPLVLDSRGILENYLGGPPMRAAGLYAEASPINFVNASTPPTLLIHGGRDEMVWAVHDERLSARLAAARRPHYYLRLPWATHGCDALLSGPSGQLSLFAIERFLAAVMP